MDVSIIIPVYRNEDTIERTLASVDASWRAAGEPHGVHPVIVVDGVVDGSIHLIEQWRHATPLTSTLIVQDNAGLGNARNAGWTAAPTEWVTFLDADDEITAERLRFAQRTLASGTAYVGCQVLRAAKGLRVPGLPARYLLEPGPTRFHFISMLVHRSMIEAIGGFDPTFHAGNDWDFAVRLRERGCAIEYVDEPFLVRHIHGDNMTMDETATQRDHLRAIREHRRRKASAQAAMKAPTDVSERSGESGPDDVR